MITGLREIGAFSNTQVCNKSCRWQVLCIPKHAREAASGMFSVYSRRYFDRNQDLKRGTFTEVNYSTDLAGGIWLTLHAENNSVTIRAGLGALAKESWGIGVTCLRAVSSRRGAHKRNCSSCAQMPLIGIY